MAGNISERSYTGLNELQISLLRMFDRNLNQKQTLEIRALMTTYLEKELLEELDEINKKKQFTAADYTEMLNNDEFKK